MDKFERRTEKRKAMRFFSIAALLVMLCACNSRYQYIPKDIAPVEVEVVRFDQAQLAVRPDSAYTDICQLYDDYEAFIPIYIEGILGLPAIDTVFFSQLYAEFLRDTAMGFAQTNEQALAEFADISDIQSSLNTAFSRLKYLYPDWEVPSVYLFVSGFNSSVMYYDDIIGVGVDMYLGSDYPYYNHVVYEYQKPNMRKECIAVDVMKMYLAYHIAYNSQTNRLLDQIIFRGKQLFLLAQILPDIPAWEIMGYTPQQWQWCEQYEQAIWNRMMQKRDLFKTESSVLSSYLNEGPFTAEITQDSPGRLGQWVGWQIVSSYMRNNKDITLVELLQESDAQKILEQSFYKP